MQSFYIPTALECIISIIENYEGLLLNIHTEINESQEDLIFSPSTNSDPKRFNIPIRGSMSPSRVIRDSKIKITEMQNYKLETMNDIDFFEENMKKNKAYINHYDTLASGWQEQEELMKKMQWDLLNFFIMMIFQAELSLTDKKNLLKFLKTSVVLENNGVNVNQELIFKYLNLSSKNMKNLIFKKMLFSIETSESTIMITNEGVTCKLEEFFGEDAIFSKSPSIKTKQMFLFPEAILNSPQILTNKKGQRRNINNYNNSKYLCDQFDFYAMMCNSRNHTWKKFLEDRIKIETMIKYLDMDLEFGNE